MSSAANRTLTSVGGGVMTPNPTAGEVVAITAAETEPLLFVCRHADEYS